MKYQYKLIGFIVGIGVCLTSCNDEQYGGNIPEGMRVEVPLTCKIASQTIVEDGNNITRAAIMLPENIISDLWVFQFNDTLDESTLLGDPLYFPMNVGSSTSTVKVAASGEAINRLVFVANNGNSDYLWRLESGKSTYANLIAKTKEITSASFPDTDKNLPLVAQWDGKINSAQITSGFELTFSHSVAKIELEIKLADNMEEGFKIRSVQLKQIPAQMRWCDPLVNMTDEKAVFPGTEYAYINYAAITDRLPTKNSPATYVWYVPRNHQGESDNTSAYQKNTGATAYATYIEILARDKNENDIRYRLYPGKDMLKNFNITSNYIYKIPLTIQGPGDPNTDSRVENLSKVVFPKANSYILNPPEGDGVKKFYIPIERVNDFWLDPAYQVLGQDPGLAFKESTYWKCEVIWTDNEQLYSPNNTDTEHLTLATARGQGVKNQYLCVRVPALPVAKQGNIVVGVYRTDEHGTIKDGCAWSWHLWVTDYNPDVSVAISEQVHTYVVPGGQVERYGGLGCGYPAEKNYSSWTSIPSSAQPYAGKVVMDRYLGMRSDALDTPNYPTDATIKSKNYLLYSNPVPLYQFGRKDPIPPIGRYAIFDKNNQKIYAKPIDDPTKTTYRKYSDYDSGKKIHTTPITMRTAIEEPDKFYFVAKSSPNYWQILSNGITSSYSMFFNYIWGDLKIPTSSAQQFDKTLFDPCPPGWRLPLSTLWNGEFTTSDGVTNSGWSRPDLNKLKNGLLGLRYWPYKLVGTESPVDGAIFYPVWLYINGNSNDGSTIADNSSLGGIRLFCSDAQALFINPTLPTGSSNLAGTLPALKSMSNATSTINDTAVLRCVQE